MSTPVLLKLLAIFAIVAIGWVVGRLRWLGKGGDGTDPARVLGFAAFYLFVPALLFRTTARIDFGTLPWGTLAAFFVPVMALLLVVYLWQRRWNRKDRLPAAAPSVRAISASFGNTVQIGIPMAAALFGEAGLAVHIAIVSLHSLVLLSVLTALVEMDLARAHTRRDGAAPGVLATLATTLRNTIVHPVVLPVVAGLAWNLLGLPLPAFADDVLHTLSTGVVPVCLVVIGLSLAYQGVGRAAKSAVVLSAVKLLLLPALVLATAHWVFGLSGLPLAVTVMAAALPIGSNALLFSQRYDTLEPEISAAIMLSTLGFAVTAPLWLLVLRAFA